MLYTEFCAGEKTYKLRLNTRNIVSLEKQLGCNPVAIFGDGDKIPTVTTMVQILNAALQQYQHGITLNDAYDIFDEWLADGHASIDFISVIIEIYQASGIINKDKKDNEPEKN